MRSTLHPERQSLNKQSAQMIECRAWRVIAMQRNRERSKFRETEERFSDSDTLRQIESGASGNAHATENRCPESIEAWARCGNAVGHPRLFQPLHHAFAECALRPEDSNGQGFARRRREIT